ncbi:hypothetical protein TNCV_758451, partial [Trichonephila clavipes]
GLELIEDSVSGLCSHMNLKCKNCSFFKGFPYDREDERFLSYKGKDFQLAKNYVLSSVYLSCQNLLSANQERKLLKATERVAQENINAALSERAQIVSLNVEYPLMVLGNAEATHL